VAGVSSLTAGLFLHASIGRRVADQVKERLTQDANLAADLLRSDANPEANADAIADRLGKVLAIRVTLVDSQGKVLGDSELNGDALERMENHASRPEIREALLSGRGNSARRSSTLAEDMLYVARRVDPADPARGVVRVAVPLTEVTRAQREIRIPLLTAALLSLLVAWALGRMVARRLAGRLEVMSKTASEIAGGNTAARVMPTGRDEIAALGRSFNRMADQLDERLSMLSRERNQLVGLLDTMVEGVLLTDGSGRILLANRAFEKIFAATPPLRGLRPLEAARVPALQEAVDAALSGDGPSTREFVLPGPEEKVLGASLVSIRENSTTVSAVVVFHDVTEIKKLEKVRREFVTNVSHELRTPLTAIRGYAETLRDGALLDSGRVREFADVIHRHARRLQALIEDLLDLSSIEQGQSRMDVGAMSLHEVVSQVEAMVKPLVAGKHQVLNVRVPATLPRIRADRDRLAQVLINLLDNAVKFTPEGGTIVLHAKPGHGRVVINVKDTGVGIPPEDLPRIFERFYRVDRSRDRREGGTGLGLAIAKHLTQAMGGAIEVQSTPGSGTDFQLTFPTA
jgi:two-component system phosphate regulon sensor histidine kinase PhoR